MVLEAITEWDFSVLNYIQANLSTPFMDSASNVISFIFAYGFIGWAVIALILLFFKKTRSVAIMMAVSMIFFYLITQLGLKNIVQRPRPFDVRPIGQYTSDYAHAHGYSFPSGHTGVAFACATIMFLKNRKIMWIMYLPAAFIGFTRMYMYVHYPTDVIAGAVFGVIIALMVYYVFKFSGLMQKIDGAVTNKSNNKKGRTYGRTKNR